MIDHEAYDAAERQRLEQEKTERRIADNAYRFGAVVKRPEDASEAKPEVAS
jgi:chromosome condensin MukBEF MukE localization factor